MRILEECIYCQVIEKITTNPGQLLGSLVYAFVAEYIDIADMNLVILMVGIGVENGGPLDPCGSQ